nr:hypothetical protein [Tanacetum cinerariifolium]
MPKMFTDEHAFDYSSPPIYDEYDDDLFKVESDIKNVYDDPFESTGEKIKESKLLIDELDLPCDFLIPSEYDSILSKDFSKTAHALIDVHGEEMILCDGDERLTLNMRHDTSSYSNQPQKESINLINDFNDSRSNVLPKKLLDLDSTKDLHPPLHVNPLSGSTTFSSSPNQLLEEFADELALITFPSGNDDL